MEYKSLTVISLVEGCVQKDQLAWAEFVRRFSGITEFAIKKILKKRPQSAVEEDTKDILQNLFISLWRNNKLADIRNRRNINYWLIITARNATIDYLRTKKEDVLLQDKSYFEGLPAKETDYSQIRENIEEADKKIKMAYGLLTPWEKLIFKLYFKKGIKIKDIAKMLNISIGSITSAITKMRQKIRGLKWKE